MTETLLHLQQTKRKQERKGARGSVPAVDLFALIIGKDLLGWEVQVPQPCLIKIQAKCRVNSFL